MNAPFYYPDFSSECRICGTSPCVVVAGHSCPETELCGLHFFHEEEMLDHEKWNDEGEEE